MTVNGDSLGDYKNISEIKTAKNLVSMLFIPRKSSWKKCKFISSNMSFACFEEFRGTAIRQVSSIDHQNLKQNYGP